MIWSTNSHPRPCGSRTAHGAIQHRKADSGPSAGPRRDGLSLGLRRCGQAVELVLAGDLDLASAPLLRAAMGWLRSRHRRIIVVDARRLDFVDLAGYRAIDASLRYVDGRRDPRIVYVSGEVLTRLKKHLAASIPG